MIYIFFYFFFFILFFFFYFLFYAAKKNFLAEVDAIELESLTQIIHGNSQTTCVLGARHCCTNDSFYIVTHHVVQPLVHAAVLGLLQTSRPDASRHGGIGRLESYLWTHNAVQRFDRFAAGREARNRGRGC
jgi:hypothetical protein